MIMQKSPDCAKSRHRATRYQWQIEESTGPLHLLNGLSCAVLVDLENLRAGARDLGYELSLDQLAQKLQQACRSVQLRAFVSANDDVQQATTRLGARQWKLYVKPIETAKTCRGVETFANVDPLLIFFAGVLASRKSKVIILGSGDGELVHSIAQAVSQLDTEREVMTLSLPGSTSQRLRADRNPYVKANLEIGLDCLTPKPRKRGSHAS